MLAAYQPIVALGIGAMVPEETVARWATRDGALIPATAFIKTAAASGLLATIDGAVLT